MTALPTVKLKPLKGSVATAEASIIDLNIPRQMEIAALALRTGANPDQGFLELTINSLTALADRHPDQILVVRDGKNKDKVVKASKALDVVEEADINVKVGLLLTPQIEPVLKVCKDNFSQKGY